MASHGNWFQGVKAVIAKSFERIHRSNLVGMGIIPLCFKTGEDAETLGLTGHERYNIDLPSSVNEIRPGQDVTVVTDKGKSFTCTLRFDTEVTVQTRAFLYLEFAWLYDFLGQKCNYKQNRKKCIIWECLFKKLRFENVEKICAF